MTSPSEDARLLLRPVIPTAAAAENVAEDFQNRSLRPILKLQHSLLVLLFEHFAAKRKFHPLAISPEQRREKIKELVAKDNRLRGLLFGMVIGQFTAAEAASYCQMEAETNRRLASLLTDRLLSHYT